MAVKVKQHKGKWWVFINHYGKEHGNYAKIS
jgi:hypothetical protein